MGCWWGVGGVLGGVLANTPPRSNPSKQRTSERFGWGVGCLSFFVNNNIGLRQISGSLLRSVAFLYASSNNLKWKTGKNLESAWKTSYLCTELENEVIIRRKKEEVMKTIKKSVIIIISSIFAGPRRDRWRRLVEGLRYVNQQKAPSCMAGLLV